MNVPSIIKTSVQIISQNEIALLLICDSRGNAEELDIMLDDFSILWDENEKGKIVIVLRSPSIGSYSYNTNNNLVNLVSLKTANVIAAAYRLETGQLDYVPPPRLLIL
jgi:hypothetical protein